MTSGIGRALRVNATVASAWREGSPQIIRTHKLTVSSVLATCVARLAPCAPCGR
jgi:hypothetical protein